jgi:hypothetical protein
MSAIFAFFVLQYMALGGIPHTASNYRAAAKKLQQLWQLRRSADRKEVGEGAPGEASTREANALAEGESMVRPRATNAEAEGALRRFRNASGRLGPASARENPESP